MSMMRTARRVAAMAAVLAVAVAATPQDTQTIGPGMGLDEVQAVFGQPQNTSSYGNFTFYFYENGCQVECGTADIVFFQDGQVVDAVLRAPWRGYRGESSSPRGVIPRPTPGGERLTIPAQVEGVEVRRVPTPVAAEDTVRADTSAVN
jgi:hypothetical protein